MPVTFEIQSKYRSFSEKDFCPINATPFSQLINSHFARNEKPYFVALIEDIGEKSTLFDLKSLSLHKFDSPRWTNPVTQNLCERIKIIAINRFGIPFEMFVSNSAETFKKDLEKAFRFPANLLEESNCPITRVQRMLAFSDVESIDFLMKNIPGRVKEHTISGHLLRLAKLNSENGYHYSALRLHQENLRRFPNSRNKIRFYDELAQAYFQVGDFEKAREFFEKGTDLSPNNRSTKLQFLLAVTYRRLGKLDEARSRMEEMLSEGRFGELYPEIHLHLGEMDHNEQNYRGALSHFQLSKGYLSVFTDQLNAKVIDAKIDETKQILRNLTVLSPQRSAL